MKLAKTDFNPENLMVEEALFHTANGYLGVRANFEEGCPPGQPTIRGCYINGYYDIVALKYPEKLYGFPGSAQRMVNLPDVQTMRLSVNGEEFSPFNGALSSYRRELDTEAGTALRALSWLSPSGQQVELEVLRMASFPCPNLFLTVYQVTLPGGGNVEICSEVQCDVANYADPADPRVAAESQKHIFFDEARLLPTGGLALCHTGESRLGLAVCQCHAVSHGAKMLPTTTPTGFSTSIRARLPKGGVLRVEKYTLLCDERRVENPAQTALALARECMAKGPEQLLYEQKRYLDGFWATSRVHIDAEGNIDEGMDYNLFMLLQSAGQDSVTSVAAKGLSGEGYEGHYFWDTEIYIFPFFALTQPQMAQKLLDYRYSVLNKARQHARIMGHSRGALYPWRTIAGSECSSYFPSGSAQYHITGDIAHSFMQYYRLTGNLDYMAEKGGEVLLETARLWLEVGHYGPDGQFRIQDVTGPDEYTCIVNNNYYTNLSARHNLLAAAQICEDLRRAGLHRPLFKKTGLGRAEPAAFKMAAQAMLLPYSEALGISAQDDSFLEKPLWDFEHTPAENYPLLLHYHPLTLYRHQVCKQADTVLAHFLFEDDTSEEVMRRSYDYYENITTHDSSLSPCVHSIMASRLGMGEKAYKYFLATIRTDLDNAHKNTKDGIHTANMGGAYLALCAGFAGLRIKENGLHFRFCLPRGWRGYRFKLWYRGSLLRVQITPGRASIRLQEGPPTRIYVWGQEVSVEAETVLMEVVF